MTMDPNFLGKVMKDIEESLAKAGVAEGDAETAVTRDMQIMKVRQLSIRFGSAYERIGRAYLRYMASTGTNNPDSLIALERQVAEYERLGAQLSYQSKKLPEPKVK